MSDITTIEFDRKWGGSYEIALVDKALYYEVELRASGKGSDVYTFDTILKKAQKEFGAAKINYRTFDNTGGILTLVFDLNLGVIPDHIVKTSNEIAKCRQGAVAYSEDYKSGMSHIIRMWLIKTISETFAVTGTMWSE